MFIIKWFQLSHKTNKLFYCSYHKTESVFKATAEKTSSIFSGFTSKISQMKNSESFKSFEERVGGAYENVKVLLIALQLKICL